MLQLLRRPIGHLLRHELLPQRSERLVLRFHCATAGTVSNGDKTAVRSSKMAAPPCPPHAVGARRTLLVQLGDLVLQQRRGEHENLVHHHLRADLLVARARLHLLELS